MNVHRLGVLGGTFDPIHNGHLLIARGVADRCALDRLLFVPSARPPHKQGLAISPEKDRYRMAQLAARQDLRFAVTDMEIKRPGLSYTVDTLDALRKEYGASCALYLILGADSLLEIDTWHAPDRLFDLATVVTVPRPGKDLAGVDPRWQDRVVDIQLPEVDISSTDIRRRARSGLPIGNMVPAEVASYIEEQGLYRDREVREG